MRAAIFDLDGTLVDSMPYWRGHLAGYLADLEVGLPDDLEIKVNETGSFQLLFNEIKEKHPHITMDDIIRNYHERMLPEYQTTILPKEGAEDYLKLLQRRRIPMCIATATPRHLFMPLIDRLNWNGYFDFYITVPEIQTGKSYPDIYEYCALRYGLANHECAVFEDTIQAITTAHDAGFYTIAIKDRTSAWAEERISAKADRFVTHYSELM